MNNSLKTSLRRFAAAIQLAHSRDVVGRAKANREVMGLVGPLVEELEGRLAGADIHSDIMGSDHCPVELVIEE